MNNHKEGSNPGYKFKVTLLQQVQGGPETSPEASEAYTEVCGTRYQDRNPHDSVAPATPGVRDKGVPKHRVAPSFHA